MILVHGLAEARSQLVDDPARVRTVARLIGQEPQSVGLPDIHDTKKPDATGPARGWWRLVIPSLPTLCATLFSMVR